MEKLTDNEIIKALGHCTNINGCGTDCPCFSENEDTCGDYNGFLKQCLDLINRQNEEIDRLLKAIEDKHCVYEKRVVTEAIKEFAERLKEYSYHPIRMPVEYRVVAIEAINSLVKEMVGDAE